MEIRAGFLERAARFGRTRVDTLMARDNLHLRPQMLCPGAARRIRRGLRQVEAYLKRLILLMALHMEPGLPADRQRARDRRARGTGAKRPALSVFSRPCEPGRPLVSRRRLERTRPQARRGGPVAARALVKRLALLRALLDDPGPRARRLAWYLARRRPGWLAAPDGPKGRAGRFDTEMSAIFDAMKALAESASRARPAPRGPAPRPPPRIRAL